MKFLHRIVKGVSLLFKTKGGRLSSINPAGADCGSFCAATTDLVNTSGQIQFALKFFF
jgi:hypothetical protein